MATTIEGYYIKKIGQNRGIPRVWLDGNQMIQAGFEAGQKYDVNVIGTTMVLQANKDGSRVVSSKKDGDKANPVIDLNSTKLLAIFDGMSSIRIVVKKGEIILVPLASELKKKERFDRLKEKLEAGEELAIGSLYHGGGFITHAIHTGLDNAGIDSKLAFVNEIREELLDHAAAHNDAWDVDTKIFSAPVQELAFDERGLAHIPKTDIMEMGIPCNAASGAGRAKTGISMPEQNEEVGHLVVGTLVILSKANPAICIFENVPAYANTASAAILRTQLKDMGYNSHERILNGREWGALENRNRWCMVAVTHGIDFSFDNLCPPGVKQQRLGDVLETIADDDPRWSAMQGLRDKEVRDKAAGKGFAMQIVTADSDSVPTITKGYAKIRSTDPKIAHPNNPNLLRQITPLEHAAIKQVPAHLIDGLSATIAHEILGQGVVYPPFRDLGQHIGNTLNLLSGKDLVPIGDTNINSNDVSKHNEFSADVLEIANEVNCTLKCAEGDKGHYIGMIVGVGKEAFIQDIGRNVGVVHVINQLSSEPLLGQSIEIKYSKGIGVITPRQKEQMSLEM